MFVSVRLKPIADENSLKRNIYPAYKRSFETYLSDLAFPNFSFKPYHGDMVPKKFLKVGEIPLTGST